MSLGAALGWKHEHVPGIETRENSVTGEMELVGWPSNLGPPPSKAEQRQIVAEYEAHLAQLENEPDEMTVLAAVLEEKGLVTKAERNAKRGQIKR